MQTKIKKQNFNYRSYMKAAEKLFVLAAWVAVYIGLYLVTKDSAIAHQMKARSVDRMGLLPPYSNEVENLNPNQKENLNYVR